MNYVAWDDPRVVTLAEEQCRLSDGTPCKGPGNDCDADNCEVVAAIMREISERWSVSMKIRTTPDNTGIAPRDCVWQAVDSDTYDGTGPIGLGATEEEAIADLMDQLEEDA